MRIGDEIWLGFDAESGEFLGASPDRDKDEMRYICESGVVQWALYVPPRPPAAPEKESFQEGTTEALIKTIKEELKIHVVASCSSTLHDQAAMWLAQWFGIYRVPAHTIEGHWSDETAPEAK